MKKRELTELEKLELINFGLNVNEESTQQILNRKYIQEHIEDGRSVAFFSDIEIRQDSTEFERERVHIYILKIKNLFVEFIGIV